MPLDLRVLLVEDVAAEAELAVSQLVRSGIGCVHHAVDSEADFRKALDEFRPHIIFSDFTLAAFDGLAALDIAAKAAPDVPFIFLSGTIGEERAIEAVRRGAVDYVLKTNLARLAPAVRRALREVAERRRRRFAELRIRESEQRLRDIIDTSQDWIWELGSGGRYVFSTESVRGMLGFAPEDLSGTHFSDYVHEEDRPTFADALAHLDTQRRTVAGVVTRWRHQDGEFRWLEGNLRALIGRDGKVTGFRGAHRDITERKHQQARIARLTRVLQMQSGINSAVVRIRDRDALLREACRLAMHVGGYEHAVVSMVTPDGQHAVPWYWPGEEVSSTIEFPIGDGVEPDTSLLGRALRTGEITVCTDLTKSEPPVANRQELLKKGYRSMVALPFIVDGARVGVLTLCSCEVDLVREEELRLLREMTANLSFALQYRQKEDAFQLLAYFDPLTGLGKRALFCERLDDLLRHGLTPAMRPVVVAFDIDRLSHVNDSFGRHVGDLLLQRVAERLKHQIDDDEQLGYLGGGSFAMVLPLAETAEENGTALLESTVFRDAFEIDGRQLRVSFKSGIARYAGVGEDGNTLVQRAEAALKQAKTSGEQYLHYQIQMHSELTERLGLEHRLRAALDEQQFLLYYQPQVNVATGQIDAVEALLRWNDPKDGLVAPARFLPVLESSGMIVAVGEWALAKAAEDCQRWQRMGLGPLRVAVNVSALQVRRRTFVENVLNRATGWPVEGYGVDIEITETGLLQDLDGTSRKLRELRGAGLRIAIDDFGTGYSSLGLLSKLPVDLLKIDRAFISGLPSDRASVTLVSSIIGLASAFNLTTIAEGVERPEQLEILRTLKCHQSQGYLHSRPVPVEQIEALLERQGSATTLARSRLR